jgi:pimeloyl-ACP methyl ester carboxylesterase
MILFHRKIGESGTPFVILHGLFGSGDNWQTHAKNWSTEYQVFLIDNRNHGHSNHIDEMDYDVMAQDLKETLDSLSLQKVHLMGHSMGGKVAMRFTQLFPEYVLKLIIVDMGIKAYPPHHDVIFSGLENVEVENCPTRKAAEDRLQVFISDISTRQFLLKNLYWLNESQLAWRFNLVVLKANIHHILNSLPSVVVNTPTLFLYGGKSNYVLQEDWPNIVACFPRAELVCVSNAGHWVHVENPHDFSQNVLNFLHKT